MFQVSETLSPLLLLSSVSGLCVFVNAFICVDAAVLYMSSEEKAGFEISLKLFPFVLVFELQMQNPCFGPLPLTLGRSKGGCDLTDADTQGRCASRRLI